MKQSLILKLSIIITVLLVSYSIIVNSPTYQEFAHLSSGFLSTKTKTFQFFNVNPPLVQLISSIPSTVFGAHSFPIPIKRVNKRIEQDVAERFIDANPDTNRILLICGRLLYFLVVFSAFILSISMISRSSLTYSKQLSCIVCLSQPIMLGFMAIISPDMLGAMMAICCNSFFIRLLKDPSFPKTAFPGIFLGLSVSSKFTLVVLYPLYIVIWILYRVKDWNSLKCVCTDLFFLSTIFFISILCINMVYGFEGAGAKIGDYQFCSQLFSGQSESSDFHHSLGNRFKGTVLSSVPVPFPQNFILGIDTQRLDFERGMESYLRGIWSQHGWWYYYFYALLIKTPLGTICLFLLAIFCTLFLNGYNNNWRDELAILLPGIVIILFVSSQDGFSVHSRYIIPSLPFFFVWISKVGRSFTPEAKELSPRSSMCVRFLTIIFLSWSLVSSLWFYPHSIAYFNELTTVLPTSEVRTYLSLNTHSNSFLNNASTFLDMGPINGPRHLLDSNIDWGQDIFELERWCINHPEINAIKTALSGNYPIEQTSIPYSGFPPAYILEPGWYALSVNYLYDKYGQYNHFMNFQPITVIGYTIYVYHITDEDILHF